MNIKQENNNLNWLLKEKYTKILNEKEKKEIINKKLAYLIIELENNPIMYLTKEKGDYNYWYKNKKVL